MRCKLLATLLLLGLMTISVSSAFAAPAWYVCSVKQTWTEPNGDLYFRCDSLAGEWSNNPIQGWFKMPSTALNKNETLATLLTAQAGGINVQIFTDASNLFFGNVVHTAILYSAN